jgi:uncharacterized membrane protein YkgB
VGRRRQRPGATLARLVIIVVFVILAITKII